MVLDFGSQVQVDSAPSSKTCSVQNKQWASHCFGRILAYVLFLRSRWWDYSVFWQYGTKSCHLQGNQSRGLEPLGLLRVLSRLELCHQVSPVRAAPGDPKLEPISSKQRERCLEEGILELWIIPGADVLIVGRNESFQWKELSKASRSETTTAKHKKEEGEWAARKGDTFPQNGGEITLFMYPWLSVMLSQWCCTSMIQLMAV